MLACGSPMLFIALKYVFFVGPASLQAVLAGFMLRRKLYREYPIFLAYTVSHVVRFAVLFCIYHQGSREAYRYTYLCAEVLDAALSFAVIYELFSAVLRSYEGIRTLAVMVFRWATVVLLVVAVLTAASARGADSERVLAGLFTLDRSVNIVRGGLLLLLFLFASYFGLNWKHFAFGIAVGFGLETSVELATFAMRAQLGPVGSRALSLISAASYNCSVLIWLAYLLSGPVQRPVKLPARAELEGWNQALLELLHQ